ncbi:sigma-70 family RNA polymerase sigma factor [Alicyclobacillus sp. SO9]|uniref:sigma-70 family RNA polymerase sigma factor n=1 Tax=Alicyclobacillus sp. SO9 TaxID=2665646 RepID=UPI0018E7C1FE|nr:sigma-70 family RNA polymerase sigma factor [Alicyclobacillus sp. SO9]QQE78744.1 sigma-70 family RNA polymerase sigma factor [Alicyclobacillus sp. SO9]
MPTTAEQPEFETRNRRLATLVKAAQSGDMEATQELIRQFQPLISSLSKRYYSVSREDAAQEAYLSLMECIAQFDASRGIPFTGYVNLKLRGDVRSAMRKIWRYDSRVALSKEDREGNELNALHHLDTAVAASATETMTDFDRAEWRILLHSAHLSSRECLGIQSLARGWSSTEIARRVGVSPDTVKTWRKRAVRKVRNMFSEVSHDK